MHDAKPFVRPVRAVCLTTLLCALALSWDSSVTHAMQGLESLDQFPSSALEVRTQQGRQWFNIWIADTESRDQQGLMFVRQLPADQGMLFPQCAPRVMRMWMRNTLIPLDMLFIDANGRIVYIREQAPPESDDIISTEQPVKAVLELAGGEVAKRHIAIGDHIIGADFGTQQKDRAHKQPCTR